MRKLYKYLSIIIAALLIHSCTKADLDKKDTGDEIKLSSLSEPSASVIRAVGNFPNDGSIGLLATTELNTAEPIQTNWRAYPDINNARATASAVNAGLYSFQWDEMKYWPFDGSDLYFLAYSPHTDVNDLGYILSDNVPSLFIEIRQNMYDIMCASGNTNLQPYNKTSGTVNLGEFQHALSQLTIQVEPATNMPSTIRITGLTVSTQARSGSLLLYRGVDGISPNLTTGNPLEITLVTGSVDFSHQNIVRSQLLFPGTEDYTQISISLVDTATQSTLSRTYQMSYFANDVEGEPIRLQRGKNTVLRIIVSVVNVENPDEAIVLNGSITDWNYQGRYGVTIQ